MTLIGRLRAYIGRLCLDSVKSEIAELKLEIRMRDEVIKINELAIQELTAVIERNRQRIEAEKAIEIMRAIPLDSKEAT